MHFTSKHYISKNFIFSYVTFSRKSSNTVQCTKKCFMEYYLFLNVSFKLEKGLNTEVNPEPGHLLLVLTCDSKIAGGKKRGQRHSAAVLC